MSLCTWQNRQHLLAGGMYRAGFEKDACGIGFVAYQDGRPRPDVIPMALQALASLVHRGGVAADGRTSDGAGILCQIPHEFFAHELTVQGQTPPEPGGLAVGMFFLPTAPEARARARDVVNATLIAYGLPPLLWREVPTYDKVLGEVAEAIKPAIWQVLLPRPAEAGTVTDFERRLYLARRAIERACREADIRDVYVCSFSSRTIVYKGLLLGDKLGEFYTDLTRPTFSSGLAIFHQRYSTNTFPTWGRAQPFRVLCHNGEINTIQGNINWMRARESTLSLPAWEDDIETLKPVIDETSSDSAMLDNVLELLYQGGRDLPHALAMLIPEAWESMPPVLVPQARRDFYAYHAALMEPWDGPAAVAFTDGTTVGMALDRNGLRPARYLQTGDGLVIAGSETGIVPLDPARVVRQGKLGPGQMVVVDTSSGEFLENEAIKARLAAARPYGQWVENINTLASLTQNSKLKTQNSKLLNLQALQAAFGYTAEELTVVLRPMAQNGAEPIGSMGDDTPVAVLSEKPRPVYHYLKQRFAQVTNPPIDPLREELVMSLGILLGHRGNILEQGPQHARQLRLDGPVLLDGQLACIRNLSQPEFRSATLDATFALARGQAGLAAALDRLAAEAEAAAENGAGILIISQRRAGPDRVPVPTLLAVGAIHHHLIRRGLRSRVSLVAESGDVRDVHQLATVIGYGAEAVNPYLALATVADLAESGKVKFNGYGPDGPGPEAPPAAAQKNLVRALEKGLRKIMSKMGISTLDSYCGAQIFEALGLGREVIDRCLAGTPSRLGGASLADLARDCLAWHAGAYGEKGPRLDSPGFYKFKRNGERHALNPTTVRALQAAATESSALNGRFPQAYEKYKEFVQAAGAGYVEPRDALEIHSSRPAIPLDEVEPARAILRRFSTAAMSHGALSAEAHETLSIAMNRLGGMGNSGEGGEAPARYGNEANSAIKQVASGRFGVTPAYLMSARELQIKMAQGSKPGEGGHLPGHKVTAEIAALRHSKPGVSLISPPPHHDIYSIEDLAQLIFDLKQVNPHAAVSVKLVAEMGVGTVAAGVVKGGADVVHISGGSGGTGASPLSSIKNAGLPFEMGLAEAQQTLMANDLRDRVRLRIDGGVKTGRDIVLAALLGADEFSFGTAALIAEGCLMARACHTNTCPVGIATQKPELRAKFPGKPEMVMAYLTFVAEEVREILAGLGFRHLHEIIGRTDLLRQASTGNPQVDRLNLAPMLKDMDPGRLLPRRNLLPGNDIHTVSALNWRLVEAGRPALDRGQTVALELPIRNSDRAVGATLAGAIAARFGDGGLPRGEINLTFKGAAGQSFGAFNIEGMNLTVVGAANDYVGKGMAGGEIVVVPPPQAGYAAQAADQSIIGNTVLYGATGGRLFAAGRAGERFAVRNSGATAVVEGAGDHGCEYMTGGTVVVLGPVGANFGAGMTGGVAYVYDADETLPFRYNSELVAIHAVRPEVDEAALRELVEAHAGKTGSLKARALLADWAGAFHRFWRVAPQPPASEKPRPSPATQTTRTAPAVPVNGS
ncbi:MAG: glutamate synthase large subunit [Anaerolineae bacterium]